MRNLSMKKFGTPIGAGPGSASEKPGLSGVGWPSTRRSCASRRARRLALGDGSAPVPVPAGSGRARRFFLPVVCCSAWPSPLGASGSVGCACCSGAVWGGVAAGGAGAGAGCGAGPPSSRMEMIGRVMPGIGILSSAVPGGTSTCTRISWPPRRVTTSVRGSAAAGYTAAPKPAEKVPATSRPVVSFFRFVMRSCVLLPRHGPQPWRRPSGAAPPYQRWQTGRAGPYSRGRRLATTNRTPSCPRAVPSNRRCALAFAP